MFQQDRHTFFSSYLFGLFIRCPLASESNRCPFMAIRRIKSLESRFQIAEELADNPERLAGMLAAHNFCYSSRMMNARVDIRPMDMPLLQADPGNSAQRAVVEQTHT